MGKFCSNCGKKLNENQDVCLGCGKVVSDNIRTTKQNTNNVGYKISTGVIMIVLGFCLICVTSSFDYESVTLVFTLPGLCGLAAGILNLCSKNNSTLLIPSGILMFVGAFINFLGIIDISIYSIIAITFGVLNLVYSKK